MNKVFLTRFPDRIIPLARVLPPTGVQLPEMAPIAWTDNDGSLANKVFGAMPGPRVAAPAQAAPSAEPREKESARNEAPRVEPQQTATEQPKPELKRAADAAATPANDKTENAPTVPKESFLGRWTRRLLATITW